MTVSPASLANLKPIPKGVSGNPGGKPVGARNRVNGKFLAALEKAFDEGGRKAIERCRDEDPSAFVRAMLALQPKELEIARSPFADLSDEQLESIFAACGAILAAQNGSAGDSRAQGEESATGLSPVQQAG